MESKGEPARVQRRTNRGSTASRPGSRGGSAGVQQRADRGLRANKQGSKGEPTEVQGQANTDLKGRNWGPTAKHERVYGENHRPHAPCCFLGVDSAALVTSIAGRYLILARFLSLSSFSSTFADSLHQALTFSHLSPDREALLVPSQPLYFVGAVLHLYAS